MMAGVILLAASCSSENEMSVNDAQVENAEVLAPVTVRVSDFSMSVEDIGGEVTRSGGLGTTRAAQDAADYTNVKFLTLAFYASDGTLAYRDDQVRSDASTYDTFGEFEFELPIGSYTMEVFGYGGDNLLTLTSMTEATFGENKVMETFCFTDDVVISNTGTPVDLSATLDRVISRLTVQSTDGRPAGAASLRTTFSAAGKGFNPLTGLATTDTGFSNTVAFTKALGETAGSINNLFLATDEQTVDVTIEVLDADENVLFTKVVEDVPLKRNRATKLTGALFSDGSVATAFQLETGWISDYNVNF